MIDVFWLDLSAPKQLGAKHVSNLDVAGEPFDLNVFGSNLCV